MGSRVERKCAPEQLEAEWRETIAEEIKRGLTTEMQTIIDKEIKEDSAKRCKQDCWGDGEGQGKGGWGERGKKRRLGYLRFLPWVNIWLNYSISLGFSTCTRIGHKNC